jgi:apolipoprotein N-acyltransferase
VPFGEYTPGYKWFPFLSSIIPALGNFSAGKNLTPLCLNHNYCLAVLICFEGIFPELSRKTAGKGASFLVNITNDAWFGRTSAPYQHLAMAAMRTVENRRAMARCANTGFSAFIDPTGHITKKTKLFKRIHLTANLPLIKENTFYTLHGDILAFICLGGIFILGIKDVKRRLLWKKLKKD